MTQLKSIPRPEPGAGVATPKGEYVYLYDVDDMDKMPTRTVGKNTYADGLTLREGAKGIKVYATPGTIEPVIEKTGETDAVGFKCGFKWGFPGDSADEQVEILANKSVIGITKTCDSNRLKVYGDKCNPLRLQAFEPTDNAEANKRVFTLQQTMGGKTFPMIYTGELPAVAEVEPEPPASEGM